MTQPELASVLGWLSRQGWPRGQRAHRPPGHRRPGPPRGSRSRPAAGAGTWRFWVTSPPMAATAGWTQGWTPPAVPAGATAVSFGLALRSDGTVATTRYSLAPVRYTSTRLITFGVPSRSG
ncbi:MAG: hypothetical protein ACR2MP_02355 [Streptosporangiaceae bacterium]